MRDNSNLRQHAKSRAQERYGIALTKDVRRLIIRKIQDGTSIYSRRLTRSRVVHVVEIEGMGWLPVIYCSSVKDIVTVLPKDAVELNEYHGREEI